MEEWLQPHYQLMGIKRNKEMSQTLSFHSMWCCCWVCDAALTLHSKHEISTLSSSDWVGLTKEVIFPKLQVCPFEQSVLAVDVLSNGCAADFVTAVSEQKRHLAGRWTRTFCMTELLQAGLQLSTIKPYVSATPGTTHTGCVCACVHIMSLSLAMLGWEWLILANRSL